MMKNAILFAVVLVGCLAVAQANFNEDPKTKSSMSEAFQNGKHFFSRFGARREQEKGVEAPAASKKPGPFSHYTAKLRSLGGGKPRLWEQYINHHYVPLTPTVVPVEHPPMPMGLTPEIAAEIYAPKPPLQFSTDEPHRRI